MASIKTPLEADNGLAIANILTIDTARNWKGSAISVSAGGTGATTATLALTNLGAAPLASPTFTGTPKAPTPTSGDISTSIATTAFVSNALGTLATTAVTYKGSVDASAATPTAAGVSGTPGNGWLYRVGTTGTTAFSLALNVGDWVIFDGSNWNKIEGTNPAVTGVSGVAVSSSIPNTFVISLATVTNSNTGVLNKVSVNSFGQVTGYIAATSADITGVLGFVPYGPSSTSINAFTLRNMAPDTASTANTVVARDANGNISANVITVNSINTGSSSVSSLACNGPMTIENSLVVDTTITTTTSTDPAAIASFSIATFRSAEFFIQASQGTNMYMTKVLLTTDGTDVYLTEFGTVSTTNSPVNNIDANITTGFLNLMATPNQTDATIFKVIAYQVTI